MPKRRQLTENQQQFIRDNYMIASRKNMAKQLHMDAGVVTRWMNANGLIVTKEMSERFRCQSFGARTSFSPEEDIFIKENYLKLPIKTLGYQIGRSYTGIMTRLRKMGLTIPTAIIQRNKESTRIKPGNTPKNKGRKQTEYMSAEQIAKTVNTRFKKGNQPHNTKDADGVISIRHDNKKRKGSPYKFIRLSVGKWDLLHKVNWEKVNGRVPKGYCLRCISGNTMDCDPGNWELITRKENYVRNSGLSTLSDKYVATKLASQSRKVDYELKEELLNHPDILEVKRKELILSREIKKQENARK